MTSPQHRLPCSDCPFSRQALRGWLGGGSVDDWLAAVHGETRIDRHVHRNQQCAGAAIYRANNAKLCRDRELLKLPADRARVFASGSRFGSITRRGDKA